MAIGSVRPPSMRATSRWLVILHEPTRARASKHRRSRESPDAGRSTPIRATRCSRANANVVRREPTRSPPAGQTKPRRTTRSGVVTERCPLVKAHVLTRSEGRCEACAKDAPFHSDDGQPYLEVHHLVPLAEEGPDVVSNAVAVCPNCHRFLHHAKGRELATSELLTRFGSFVAAR
ncbi:MAG: hypothetical protein DI536_12925 [Archangium gephyra]|uniref:HNH nuclease domain-containing protein n=1 Tax=Archangium gephyra TaxID=48 RepID=A0A2W5UVE9_9BACT|nr:MAG: hypothetical protein DI536_12925 [Archangium gephyra]